MRLTIPKRLMNKQQFDGLKQSVNRSVAEGSDFFKLIKEKNKKTIFNTLFRLQDLYIRLIKLDQVELYQKRVKDLQEQLLNARKMRMEASRQAYQVSDKSSELQREISKVDRHQDSERYHDLLEKGMEMFRLEKAMSRTLKEYEEVERDIFTDYSNAIAASYEKQNVQAEYKKSLIFIYSAVALVVTIALNHKTKVKHEKDSQKINEIHEAMKRNDYSTVGSIVGYTKKGGVFAYNNVISPTWNGVTSGSKSTYNYITGYFTGKRK